MASKSARFNAKHAARQQQQQPHASLDSCVNAPLRVYPSDVSRTAAASPLMQMIQSVTKPVPVVGILSTSCASPERAFAFANRLIGKYAFDAMTTLKDTAPLAASAYLYYDAAKPCAYLVGIALPDSACVDDSTVDTSAMERERFKLQLLLHTSCSLVFVLHTRARFSPTLLRDVRSLATEKQQLLTALTAATGVKATKKSQFSSYSSPFAPGHCVPFVVFVVPAPDDVLPVAASTTTASKALVAYNKALELKLTTLLRSLRSNVVGVLRLRDALTAAHLQKERRVWNIDPSHCVVVVSSATATVCGSLDARLDDWLEALDVGDSGDEWERDVKEPVDVVALEDDDMGLSRATQFLHRFVDQLVSVAGSIAPVLGGGGGNNTNSKDTSVRIDVLSLAQWLKAWFTVIKTLQRLETTKRKTDASVSDAVLNAPSLYNQHQQLYSSTD